MPVDFDARIIHHQRFDKNITFQKLKQVIDEESVISHFATCPNAPQHRSKQHETSKP